MSNYDLIEYLKEKGIKDETINKILIFYGENENIDILKKIKFLFNIMNYAGVSNEQLDNLLYLKTSILNKDNDEIIKTASILNETGMIDELFSKNSTCKNVIQYKRIFMRNFIAERSGRYNRKVSASFLTCSESDAYGTYLFDLDIKRVLNMSILNDNSLEQVLNSCMTYNGVHITVDDYITKSSIKFYKKYKERQLKQNARSI